MKVRIMMLEFILSFILIKILQGHRRSGTIYKKLMALRNQDGQVMKMEIGIPKTDDVGADGIPGTGDYGEEMENLTRENRFRIKGMFIRI